MEVSRVPVDELLESIEDDTIRATMEALDTVIATTLAGRRRVLWEGVFWGGTDQQIIGYGDITQPRPRGGHVNWFLVGLARQKSNYSLYVNAVEDGEYLGKRYANQLGKVKAGSASIGFRKLEDLDLDALRAMLERANDMTPPDPA